MIRVPRGKRVKFFMDGGQIPGLEDRQMILEEDLTLSLSSNFEQLVGGGSNRGISALGNVVRDFTGFGFSGQFKQLGFKTWTGTQPLSSSFSVGFYMRNNARRDVWEPARALMKLPLPEESDNGIGLVAPGPSLIQALDDDGEPSDEQQTAGRRISCRIGFVRLPSVIISRAQPIFSSEVDTNGYPIWARIQLDISTIFTATTGLIDEMGDPGDGE